MRWFAKTLWKSDFPDYVKKEIQQYTNHILPHFFKYAKDKTDDQVEERNESFVNRLYDIIKDVRLNFMHIGLEKPDYKLLMSNPAIKVKVEFTDYGKIIKEKTDPMILKYVELNKKHYFKIDSCSEIINGNGNKINDYKLKEHLMYTKIKEEVLESLSVFGYNNIEIADILVKFLYGIKDSKYKDLLWVCYGDILLNNLKQYCKSKEKIIKCEDCGRWFVVHNKNNQSVRCECCYDEHRKQRKLETQRIRRLMKSEEIKSQKALN